MGTLPKVRLRELTLDDVEDRYQWCLDKEIEICKNRTNGYEQKAIISEEGKHIGWIDLKNIDKFNKHAEVGITVGDKKLWGKGYGLLAMREMLIWGILTA